MRAFLMAWEEKESGWGQRPDGWSVHVSPVEYAEYLKRHWALVPQPLPLEYSRPLDKPLLEAELPDDHPLARRLALEKSLYVYQYEDDRYELERLTGVTWPGP